MTWFSAISESWASCVKFCKLDEKHGAILKEKKTLYQC